MLPPFNFDHWPWLMSYDKKFSISSKHCVCMRTTSLSSRKVHYSTFSRSCLLFKKLFTNIWPRSSIHPQGRARESNAYYLPFNNYVTFILIWHMHDNFFDIILMKNLNQPSLQHPSLPPIYQPIHTKQL